MRLWFFTPAAGRRWARGKRQLALFKWGLIPSWAKDAKIPSVPKTEGRFSQSQTYLRVGENAKSRGALWGAILLSSPRRSLQLIAPSPFGNASKFRGIQNWVAAAAASPALAAKIKKT